jgi:serine/threonine-protein kinase
MKDLLQKTVSAKTLLLTAAILLFFLLFLALVDDVLMPWYTKHGESLAVPSVVAKPMEEAKDILEEQGLEVVKAGEKYDARLPFGYVVDQNPRAKRLVKKGRRIYLTMSIGEKEIEMPKLLDLSETNAVERIKSFGLRLGEIDYTYSREPANVVIKQSAEPKSYVKLNTTVDLVVSLGEAIGNSKVPELAGLILKEAIRELKRSGLQAGRIRYKVLDGFLPDTVVQQSLPPGHVVSHGTSVDLVVTTVGQ